jgi:hypothetical protein
LPNNRKPPIVTTATAAVLVALDLAIGADALRGLTREEP